MNFLALDLGSSYIKAAILNLDSFAIVRYKSIPMPSRIDYTKGFFEVSAEQIFVLVKGIIDCCLAEHGGAIGGILLSTQMHGFVLSDKEGRSLTNYISWQDERCLDKMPGSGKTYLQDLEAIISREEMRHTGVYLKAPLALCNLYTLRRGGFHVPQDTHFCTLGSYIILRLTGRNICHITNAGPTGFADIVNGNWNQALIEKIGCMDLIFPELRNDLTMVAHYKQKNIGIPVYPDLGDHQASILGSMAHASTDININIGTAAQISNISRHFSNGSYEVRPYFENFYLNAISRMPGGRNLDVLIEFIQDVGAKVFDTSRKKEEVWERVQKNYTSDSKGLKVNTSFFKTMESDSGAITSITNVNLRLDTVFAAAYEDFAVTYDKYINKVCDDRSKVERIVFSGGVAYKSPELRKAVCRVTGLKGVLPPIPDEVFVGLFRVALVCGKVCPDIEATYDLLVYNKEQNLIRLTVV